MTRASGRQASRGQNFSAWHNSLAVDEESISAAVEFYGVAQDAEVIKAVISGPKGTLPPNVDEQSIGIWTLDRSCSRQGDLAYQCPIGMLLPVRRICSWDEALEEPNLMYFQEVDEL